MNSDGPIQCIHSLNRMIRYSVVSLPATEVHWSGLDTASLPESGVTPPIFGDGEKMATEI